MTEQAPQPSKPETSRTVTRVSLVFESFRQFLREYGSHISMGGMFIGARRPLPPGSLCQLEFRLRDGYPLILGRGEVVWTRAREEGPGRPPGMGVRFHELEGSSRDLVFGIVEHRLAEGDSLFRLDEDGDLMDETPENLDKLLKEAERRRERAESEARASTIGSTQKLSAGAVLAEAAAAGDEGGPRGRSAGELPIEEPPIEELPVEEPPLEEPPLEEPPAEEPPEEEPPVPDEPREQVPAAAQEDHDLRTAVAEDEEEPLLALPYDGDAVAEEEGWELEDAQPEAATPVASVMSSRDEPAKGSVDVVSENVVSEQEEAGRWDAGDLYSGAGLSESGLSESGLSESGQSEAGYAGAGHVETGPVASGQTETGPARDRSSEELAARRARDEELGETLRDMPLVPLSEREPGLPVTVAEDEAVATEAPQHQALRGRPAAGLPADSGDAVDLDQLFSVAPAADPLAAEDRSDPWTERDQQRRKRRRGMLGIVLALVILAGAAVLLVRLAGWWPPSSDPATSETVASETVQESSSEAGTDAVVDPASGDFTATGSASEPGAAPEVIDVGAEEPATDAVETAEPAATNAADPVQESPPPPTAQAAATSVQDIRWTRSGNTTRVTVTLDGALPESRFTNQRLGSGAPRQLLRLRGITQAFRPPTLEVDTDQLQRIRTGRHFRNGVDELHLVLDLAGDGVTVTRAESRGRTLEIWVSSDS